MWNSASVSFSKLKSSSAGSQAKKTAGRLRRAPFKEAGQKLWGLAVFLPRIVFCVMTGLGGDTNRGSIRGTRSWFREPGGRKALKHLKRKSHSYCGQTRTGRNLIVRVFLFSPWQWRARSTAEPFTPFWDQLSVKKRPCVPTCIQLIMFTMNWVCLFSLPGLPALT